MKFKSVRCVLIFIVKLKSVRCNKNQPMGKVRTVKKTPYDIAVTVTELSQ